MQLAVSQADWTLDPAWEERGGGGCWVRRIIGAEGGGKSAFFSQQQPKAEGVHRCTKTKHVSKEKKKKGQEESTLGEQKWRKGQRKRGMEGTQGSSRKLKLRTSQQQQLC